MYIFTNIFTNCPEFKENGLSNFWEVFYGTGHQREVLNILKRQHLGKFSFLNETPYGWGVGFASLRKLWQVATFIFCLNLSVASIFKADFSPEEVSIFSLKKEIKCCFWTPLLLFTFAWSQCNIFLDQQ